MAEPMKFQGLIKEGLKEEGVQIWDSYREYEPASLQAIIDWITPRTVALMRQEPEGGDRKSLRILLARLYVAESHLHHRVVQLGKPPRFGDLSTSIPEWARAELTDKQVGDAVRNQHMWVEFNRRKNDGEKAKDIREDLAEKYELSPGTMDGILYGD